MEKTQNNSAVIFDVDGVINGFSNKRFYISFIYTSLHELAKINGRKQLLHELPKLKKMGGPNALFAFAKDFCKDEQTFKKFSHNLFLKLNYDLIEHDPSLMVFMGRLNSFSNIIVRTDGLSEIARATWLRIMSNQSSSQIKEEMIRRHNAPSAEVMFFGEPIQISGIVENNFKTKAQGPENWQDFSNRHQIDLSKSILIDDSQNNCKVAQELGMTTVHISKLASLTQGSALQNITHKSLSDILGVRLSHTLKSMNIRYGKAVDIQAVFKKLLETPAHKALQEERQKHSMYAKTFLSDKIKALKKTR